MGMCTGSTGFITKKSLERFLSDLVSVERTGKAGSSPQMGRRCMLFRDVHVPLAG
jgi:hypothetical protein